MTKALRWIGIALGVLLVLPAAVALALHQWVRTDDFRQRVEREASAALGVPLKLGALGVDVFPLPAVAVDQLRIETRPAITLERVEARPRWAALLQGDLNIATLVVRDAVVPAQGIAALTLAMDRKSGKGKATKAGPAETPGSDAARADAMAYVPRRAVLERVTWVDAAGQRMTVDAQARLGDEGLLDSASFKVLQGRFAGTQGSIEREADHWPVRIDIGGGKVAGKLRLAPGKDTARVLSGNLDTSGVEVSALTAPSRTLTGRLEAQTSLRAEFKDPAQIADVLQTSTRFTVKNAVVHGIDLAQAVKSVGISRGGQTRLDTLAGQVTTQGRAVHLTNLVASSGTLAATGNVAMAPNKALNGRVTVELASSKGNVGVPLAVGGTIDSPSVNLSQGALVGAALGTLLAPGVGTAAGATTGDKLGDKLKGLFGR